MNYNIFFSPTGGTKKVVQYMGDKFADAKNIDITLEITDYHMVKEDFCIIGVPSFGGRVPEIAVKRLKRFYGENTPALLVVTYGNRAYEDTLKELKDVLEPQGFLCMGAAAVVTQHSIMPGVGAGRPGREDYLEIEQYMTEIKKRLQEKLQTVKVPGNIPYKERHDSAAPLQVSDNCKKCGLCAEKCPVHAILSANPQITDTEKCISCMRCVHICPVHARKYEDEKLEKLTERLKEVCSNDKKNEFF